jgi:hypothetical protein
VTRQTADSTAASFRRSDQPGARHSAGGGAWTWKACAKRAVDGGDRTARDIVRPLDRDITGDQSAEFAGSSTKQADHGRGDTIRQ